MDSSYCSNCMDSTCLNLNCNCRIGTVDVELECSLLDRIGKEILVRSVRSWNRNLRTFTG